MRHFMQYHNTEKMGGPPQDLFRVLTQKVVDEDIVGERIWLIVGQGSNPSKRFFLHSTFVADHVGDADAPDFFTEVRGSPGMLFDPPIEIGGEYWFPQLLSCTGNFQFGFKELTGQHGIIGGLRTLGGC